LYPFCPTHHGLHSIEAQNALAVGGHSLCCQALSARVGAKVV
jgi:hypothetical protein